MEIIDAQVHIYRTGTPTPPHLPPPYLAEHAIRDMDAAGIDAALLHPPASWDPASNDQAFDAVAAYPGRFAIMANPPLDRPDSATLIADWIKRPGVLGFRFYFNKPHNKTWAHDGTLDWLWPTAEKAGAPIALLAGDWLAHFGKIAERHPGLKLIVDHMGALRGAKGNAAFPNMAALTALAKHPNVAVKLTGGPFYADDAYPFKSLHPHYRAMYDAFGPKRLFWGTDITKMPCSWTECRTHFEEIDWIPAADKKLILGDAVCQWLDWKR
ncbi:MAG: amidohydrolase family protein [Hyphomicrobiaceae bacterium]